MRVITGTNGILSLKGGESTTSTPLFLLSTENEKWIPVPEIFWKILHDVENKSAIAFVGNKMKL